MMQCFVKKSKNAIALHLADENLFTNNLKDKPGSLKKWLARNNFKGKANTFCMVPESLTENDQPLVYYGIKDVVNIWSLGAAAEKLPPGDYQLVDDSLNAEEMRDAISGWALGCYQFDRYQKSKPRARLVVPALDKELSSLIESITLIRDLINTPAADMMPKNLAGAMKIMAKAHGALFTQIRKKNGLKNKYPLIHAVGRASKHKPRLLKMEWGKKTDPKVVLIGKGICFDSGGLDIKPASGMRYMQKDMGGAAHVIGLANLIMANKLAIQLTVLVPAAENAISANAFRPGDILTSSSGKTIEIDNTDAEGRLVLADALHEATELQPELIIDFATLTGAARVAVGTEIAAFFSNNADLAIELAAAGEVLTDPVWQLPLHKGYGYELKSDRAELKNCASSGFGGAITAALFLQEFIDDAIPWIHFDVMAWNNRSRPGRPRGGEAMGIRSMFACLQSRYGK